MTNSIGEYGQKLAVVELLVGNIYKASPYDGSVCTFGEVQGFAINGEPSAVRHSDISKTLERLEVEVVGWDELVQKAAQVDAYILPGLTHGNIMDAVDVHSEITESERYQKAVVVGASQFNAVRELIGKGPITISENDYLITNNFSATEEIAMAMVIEDYQLQTPVGALRPLPNVEHFQYWDNSVLSTILTFVVPDRVIDDLRQSGYYPLNAFTNMQFVKGSNANQVIMERIMDTGIPGVTNLITRQEMIAQSNGLRLMVTYLALYIGLVLLVATAAVLAVQLLSLTIDSLGRYRMLSKIGCDASMLNRSLFAQVLIYFLLPLVLAACHSGWTINVMSDSLFKAFGSNLAPSILMAAALVLVVYGGYMLVTYLAGRSVIKTAKD